MPCSASSCRCRNSCSGSSTAADESSGNTAWAAGAGDLVIVWSGAAQTLDYMDRRNAPAGHLPVFDLDETKSRDGHVVTS